MKSQTQRILDHFLAHPNEEIPLVTLHRVGSGKELGFCSSISRRISGVRKLGYDAQLTRTEFHDGQKWTWYRLNLSAEAKQ